MVGGDFSPPLVDISDCKHSFHAIPANYVDLLCGADAVSATGAKVFPAVTVWIAPDGGQSAACGGVAAYYTDVGRLVAIDTDFFYIVVKYPFNQSIRGGCVRPSVFVGFGNDKADRLCCCFELLIVICAAPATILYIEHGIIVHVTHFVEKCSNGIFKVAVECPRADVDFML